MKLIFIIVNCFKGEMSLFKEEVGKALDYEKDPDSTIVLKVANIIYTVLVFPVVVISTFYQCFLGYFLAVLSAYSCINKIEAGKNE